MASPDPVVALPEEFSLERRAVSLYEHAAMLAVTSTEAYVVAVEELKRLKRMREAWKTLNARSIAAAKLALDEAKALHKKIDEPLATAYDDLKDRCEDYLRQAQQARVAALAAPRPAVMPPPPPPGSSVAEEFDKAVEQGDVAKAQYLLTIASATAPDPPPMPPPPPLPPPPPPKLEGTSVANSWTYDLYDEAQVPDEFRMACKECHGVGTVLDRKAIGAVVKAMKNRTNIPGVHARPDTALRVRS